jgi:predicted nucleotidyltransferase
MKNRLQTYRQSRDELLTRIVTELSNDERFSAAWLIGSYARNESDDVSDLDIRIVVAHPHSKTLCARQNQVSHQTISERLELFSRFGKPALIHENNHNAPENGTFTFVLYSDSAIMIDWVLMPELNAERPAQSLLLFEKGHLPVSAPPALENVEESKKTVAEQWAFFWMMTAVTTKYIIRRDDVFVIHWLENLHRITQDIQRRISRQPWQYIPRSLSRPQTTGERQIESLKRLCEKMQELKPQVAEFTGSEPFVPITEIEALFSLTKN